MAQRACSANRRLVVIKIMRDVFNRRNFLIIAFIIALRLGVGALLNAVESNATISAGVASPGGGDSGFAVAVLVTAAALVLAIVMRIVILPRFKQRPSGVQSVLEVPVALAVKVRPPHKEPKAKKPKKQVDPEKKRRRRIVGFCVLALWLLVGFVIGLIPHKSEGLHVEILAPKWNVWGMSINSSVFMAIVATIIITIGCVIIRLLVIPKFKEKPSGIQTVLETMVAELSKYTREKGEGTGDNLSAYMLAVALMLVISAALELFAFRPPTADLIMTFSLALCTFLLVNYYGIRKKGIGGRLHSFAEPMKLMVPFKIISELANPISLACRLFGNMLGGMIVMELVYMALGNFAVGPPGVLGIYFNMFHPLIQTFIFITLSLTFISEATEQTEKEG